MVRHVRMSHANDRDTVTTHLLSHTDSSNCDCTADMLEDKSERQVEALLMYSSGTFLWDGPVYSIMHLCADTHSGR